MFGLSTGAAISAVGAVSATIFAAKKYGDDNLFKATIGPTNLSFGQAAAIVTGVGHVVTGYFLPQLLSVSLNGGYNLLVAAGEISLAAGLYIIPNMGFELPTVSYMFKGHQGLVQTGLEYVIGHPLNFLGIGLDSEHSVSGLAVRIGIEAIDWMSYTAPVGAAIYHVKSYFFGNAAEAGSDAVPADLSKDSSAQQPSAQAARDSQGSNFNINIQNCYNCTFVETKTPDLQADTYMNMDAVRQILENFQAQSLEHTNDNTACAGNSSVVVELGGELLDVA